MSTAAAPVLETLPAIPAARFVGAGKIEFAPQGAPKPGPGQLLLRVRANALCGSERHQFHHGSRIVPGHEAVGEVIANGPGTSTRPGTLGCAYLMEFCGQCRSCLQGKTNQCRAKTADIGFSRDGGYGAYALVAERAFLAAPGVDAVDATLLLDVMGTGGHAIARAKLVHQDIRSVLVLGGGPIGLGVLAMAKLILGKDVRVHVTEFNAYRRGLVEKLGGIPIDRAATSVADALRGQDKPDIAVDTSGKAVARREAMDVLDACGALVCVGHGEGLDLDVSRDLIGKERAVLGSEYFPFKDMAPNLALLRANRAYLAQVVTHRLPLAELPQAFAQFWAGDTGKVVVHQ